MIRFLPPNSPGLRPLDDGPRQIEGSEALTNDNPTNRRFEQAPEGDLFAEGGACVTIGTATMGLVPAARALGRLGS